MLLAVWSPKGGCGTSVVAASLALVLARRGGARLADLAGDQPAVLGLPLDPRTGLADWLAVGSDAPPDALERLAVEAAPGLVLLPRGERPAPAAGTAEAGRALGRLLRDDGVATVADLGRAHDPAQAAVAEHADVGVLVVRACYLALRRAVQSALTPLASGVVVVEEPARALGVREVSDVLSLPVLTRFPVRPSLARAVDAGVLAARLPDPLARPASALLERLGVTGSEAAA